MSYLCKDSKGRWFESSPETTDRLDREHLRGIINLPYAMKIQTGSGSDNDGEKYLWSKADDYRVVFYPDAGGSEAYIKAPSTIGWVIDANDEMPHEVWIILLRNAGGRLSRQDAYLQS